MKQSELIPNLGLTEDMVSELKSLNTTGFFITNYPYPYHDEIFAFYFVSGCFEVGYFIPDMHSDLMSGFSVVNRGLSPVDTDIKPIEWGE